MHINDLVELDRRAVLATLRPLTRWNPQAPTPCAGWRATDLIAHLSVQQRGFARAVAGERTEVADWARRPSEPLDYRMACETALAAFARLSDPDAPALLPEIVAEPVPVRLAVGFHLVDNVVHAWDLAATFGAVVRLDDAVLATALAIARQVPGGATREQPGAAFAPARPVPSGASTLEETLLLLGRDPAWRLPAGVVDREA